MAGDGLQRLGWMEVSVVMSAWGGFDGVGMLGASFNFYYLGLYIFMAGISFCLASATSFLIAWSRIAEEQGVLK